MANQATQAYGLVIGIVVVFLLWTFVTDPILFGVVWPSVDTSGYSSGTAALWSMMRIVFVLAIVGAVGVTAMRVAD